MKKSEELLLKQLGAYNINDSNVFYTMLDIYNNKTKQEFNQKMNQLDEVYIEIENTEKELEKVSNDIIKNQNDISSSRDMFDTMKKSCESLTRLNPEKKEEYEKDLIGFKENTDKLNKGYMNLIDLYLPSKYRVERRLELLKEMETVIINCIQFFVDSVVLGGEIFGLEDEDAESGDIHEN